MLTPQLQAMRDALARRADAAPQMNTVASAAPSSSPQLQAVRDALARRAAVQAGTPSVGGLQAATDAAGQMGYRPPTGPGVANAMSAAREMGYRPPDGAVAARGLPAPGPRQNTGLPPRDELTDSTAHKIAEIVQRQQSGAAGRASGQVMGMTQGRGVFAGQQQAQPMPVRPIPNLFGGG